MKTIDDLGGCVRSRVYLQRILYRVGVTIDGDRPWDIRVTDGRFYNHVLLHGSLGFGEAYMNGWWECNALAVLFSKLCVLESDPVHTMGEYLERLRHALFNLQAKHRVTEVAHAHYNLSNEMYELMLDPYMQYSCGYWNDATSLEQAQLAKMDLICRKLHLRSADRVLEIGSGWGGLAKYMSATYGCHVTAYNVSTEQVEFSRRLCRGLPVEVVQADYRDIRGRYDKVVSIAMFEAVGPKNYPVFMDVVHRALQQDGLFLLHTIGANLPRRHTDRWILKYIFPNGYIPSVGQLGAAIDGRFVLEDWHNFGPDYDTTLIAWADRFQTSWPKIAALSSRFDQRFYRMWRYYLLSCAGAFRGRTLNLWQLMMTRRDSGNPYQRIARA